MKYPYFKITIGCRYLPNDLKTFRKYLLGKLLLLRFIRRMSIVMVYMPMIDVNLSIGAYFELSHQKTFVQCLLGNKAKNPHTPRFKPKRKPHNFGNDTAKMYTKTKNTFAQTSSRNLNVEQFIRQHILLMPSIAKTHQKKEKKTHTHSLMTTMRARRNSIKWTISNFKSIINIVLRRE